VSTLAYMCDKKDLARHMLWIRQLDYFSVMRVT